MGRAELWAELMKLTPEERVELVEELWDSIAQHDLPALTPEEREELDRRYAEHLRDPSTGLKWEDVKTRLLARYK
ncbi:MAG TPA: addiction module protein [Xanthobacteraceae bacterium]|nr:addiction module protein [Xanthobacteraceae bacterium]